MDLVVDKYNRSFLGAPLQMRYLAAFLGYSELNMLANQSQSVQFIQSGSRDRWATPVPISGLTPDRPVPNARRGPQRSSREFANPSKHH